MFATFTSNMDARVRGRRIGSPAALSRPRRSRACDRCRTYRVKCDDGQPCRNCRNRGVACSREKSSESPSSSSTANRNDNDARDLEMLRARVAELEDRHRRCASEHGTGVTAAGTCSPQDHDPDVVDNDAAQWQERWQWPGVWIPDPRTRQLQHHGPTSFDHFTYRMSAYLISAGHASHLADALQSCSSGRGAPCPQAAPSDAPENRALGEKLMRRQEEYLLSSFWQSYHSTTPIVDEDELRRHYDSLWPSSWSPTLAMSRKPSPLIDIILALCMQHSSCVLSASGKTADACSDDASLQGRWLYQRCQAALQSHLNAPSVLALQSRIYSTIYLDNLSAYNSAHNMLAAAVQSAYALGLHHEPRGHLPKQQRALLRRIWWTLIFLDTRLSLELGRPHLIHASDIPIELPNSDQRDTAMTGVGTAVYEGVSWLSYNTQCVRLMMALRAIASSFSQRCGQAMAASECISVYDNPKLLERFALFQSQNMTLLQDWIQHVPLPLQLPRKKGGEPFSLSRGAVDVGTFVPLWLQRQRVLLELLYHNSIMCLHRPFIQFPLAGFQTLKSGPSSITPMADGLAVSALCHAMATVSIVHQILTESDLLNSWNEVYQYQWEATAVLLGFSLIRPLCPYVASARNAIAMAIDTFEIFASYGFVTASGAARVAREIGGAVDETIRGLRDCLASAEQAMDQEATHSSSGTSPTLVQQMASQRNSTSPTAPGHCQSPSQLNAGASGMAPFTPGSTPALDVSDDIFGSLEPPGAPENIEWGTDLGFWAREMEQIVQP